MPLTDLAFRLLARKGYSTVRLVQALLVFDILVVSGILFYSGGPTNPFSIVYLVHVVLGAVLLGERWTWITAILTSICFAFVFKFHISIPEWHHASGDHSGHHLSLHLQGMWFSYVAVAGLVAYFLSRIIFELEESVSRVRQMAANHKRLASLTAFAADTAHRISSPLGTILVAAHEMERTLRFSTGADEDTLRGDVSTICREAERCREILDQLCLRAGSVTADTLSWWAPGELVKELLLEFDAEVRGEVSGLNEVYLPRRPVYTVVQALVSNAVDAQRVCGMKDPVLLQISVTEVGLIVEVVDHGPGIAPEIRQALGQPFTTSKVNGMGLGVYLSMLVVEELKGSIEFDDGTSTGTTARIVLPARTRTCRIASAA
jgi:two-component system sensor histidine kinase RegB